MNDVHSLLLQVISSALFGKKAPDVAADQLMPLVNESKAQAVYPLAFSVIDSQLQEKLSSEKYADCSEDFFRYAIAGTQNFAEHGELHELMTANKLPYVAMKGLASAMYYPEPNLRSMGDVDFLVEKENVSQAGMLLESIGFAVDHGEEDDGIHIAYKRPPMSIWELHHSVNGIPNNDVGKLIKAEMSKAISTSETVKVDGSICRLPDKLHHGLIMLLHTASHLTGEGVGLRHLCDWVVFVSALSDVEFREIFEKKLKRFGLWRFAQVLTLLGINYLGAPKRVWALEAIESHKVDDTTLVGLMDDILSGGNFGFKDMNRYREIKYISDRGEGTVGKSGILRQGFKTMNEKVRRDYKTLGKHKVLLPVGYLAEGGKYIALLLTGKRKSSGTKQMFKEAAERKRIYSSLNLFQ
nr:nucleotidyltransferase family protein [uncultured Ruminococcus sp.]